MDYVTAKISFLARGAQSAIAHYGSCAPCNGVAYRRKRRKQAKRDRELRSQQALEALREAGIPIPGESEEATHEDVAGGEDGRRSGGKKDCSDKRDGRGNRKDGGEKKAGSKKDKASQKMQEMVGLVGSKSGLGMLDWKNRGEGLGVWYQHPYPTHTNPYWDEEISMGPGPPRKGKNADKARKGRTKMVRRVSADNVNNGGSGIGSAVTMDTGSVERTGTASSRHSAYNTHAMGSRTGSGRGKRATTAESSVEMIAVEHGMLAASDSMRTSVETLDVSYRKRIQREDELLWGRCSSTGIAMPAPAVIAPSATNTRAKAIDTDTTAPGLLSPPSQMIPCQHPSRPSVLSRSGTDYSAYTTSGRSHNYQQEIRAPPVNDMHPPVVSVPEPSRERNLWMLQPPPKAKVQMGKEKPGLTSQKGGERVVGIGRAKGRKRVDTLGIGLSRDGAIDTTAGAEEAVDETPESEAEAWNEKPDANFIAVQGQDHDRQGNIVVRSTTPMKTVHPSSPQLGPTLELPSSQGAKPTSIRARRARSKADRLSRLNATSADVVTDESSGNSSDTIVQSVSRGSSIRQPVTEDGEPAEVKRPISLRARPPLSTITSQDSGITQAGKESASSDKNDEKIALRLTTSPRSSTSISGSPLGSWSSEDGDVHHERDGEHKGKGYIKAGMTPVSLKQEKENQVMPDTNKSMTMTATRSADENMIRGTGWRERWSMDI
jgi:hypothetical protein